MDIRKQKEKIYNKIDECREKKKVICYFSSHVQHTHTQWRLIDAWYIRDDLRIYRMRTRCMRNILREYVSVVCVFFVR